MHCIIIDRIDSHTSDDALPKYCFENDLVPLRYTRGRGSDETTYNNYLSFQDRYVASEIAVTRAGRMFLKIHIQELGSLDPIDEALFKPTPGSSGPLGGRITLSDDVLFNYYLTHHALPEFPHRLNGNPAVTVRFVVGKNGRVLQADALDGPEILRKPCLDAVWKWQFRPYLILGEPVEVESQTVVQFPTLVGTWGR